MSNSEMNPQAEYLDRVLLEFGPERIMRSTVLGVAPTHVAKTNLEKRTQLFGVACKTMHSAFLTPKFPLVIAEAVNDLNAIFSQFPQIHAKHIEDHEARFRECVSIIKKIKPDRVEEFRTHLKETHSAETALAQVGVNVLELADGWVINPDRKFKPLLTVLDETSMVPARTILDIIGTTTLVACGDHAQLPAVESGEKKNEDAVNSMWNGLEAAANADGSVKHEFVYNYRLRSEAPVLVEVMSALRRAASADDGSASSEVALALSLIRQNKGGVAVVDELSSSDAASIMRGENVALAWRNATRHWLLDAARASIGLTNASMIIGEPVIPTLRTRDNREVVAAVQGAEIWHFAGDEFGSGFGDFEWTSNEERKRIRLNYAFEYREDRAYSRLGNFRGCAATLAFGYVRTTHKAQGRQWPRVFISMSDVVAMHSFCRMRGQLREFVRWLYTAVSRAEHDVVFFHNWPKAIPYEDVNSVREALAANITTPKIDRHKGPLTFGNMKFPG